MLSIVRLDVRRILRSKATWALLLLALGVMALKTVQFAHEVSLGLSFMRLDTSGFTPFASSGPVVPQEADIAGVEASPLLRLMLSFDLLEYLALAAIVIFGGFFAQDISSDYVLLRRSRGVSPRRLFAANLMTIAVVSFVFSAAGIAFLYVVCLAVNPESVNALTNGQQVLAWVGFLPQEAAAYPLAYVGLFVALYTAILSFLGMLGYVSARISRRVLVAAVAPALLILIFGRLTPALPWLFQAFNNENLSFASRGIVDLGAAVKYAGVYPIWLAAFCVLGLLSPDIATTIRRVRSWPRR